MPLSFEQLINNNIGCIQGFALPYAPVGESEDLYQEIIQIEKAEKQIKLYKSLPFRFILPALILVIISAYSGSLEHGGELIPTTQFLLFYMVVTVIFGLSVFAVKSELKSKVIPMLGTLQALQQNLMAD